MTNDNRLGRVADELKDDATFLSGWLPEQPDGRDVLRQHVKINAENWSRLLLCRPPAPSTFWDDAQKIASYVQADPLELARGLREAAVLGALHEVLGAARSLDEEFAEVVMSSPAPVMAAARDAALETVPLQASPRARIEEMADEFWTKAGMSNGDRDLQRATSIALPLAVTFLPQLGLQSVTGWLNAYGVSYEPDEPDRPLRGLLMATRGLGLVFIDGAAPGTERRFTLAHEIGHFLFDYLEPRKRVLEAEPGLVGVLDGEREPTKSERARAMLQRLPIGTYTKFLERDPSGGALESVEEAEDEATLFAMELLAPWDESVDVVQRASGSVSGYDEALGAATQALATSFDLPGDVARARAQACLEASGRRRGLFDR